MLKLSSTENQHGGRNYRSVSIPVHTSALRCRAAEVTENELCGVCTVLGSGGFWRGGLEDRVKRRFVPSDRTFSIEEA